MILNINLSHKSPGNREEEHPQITLIQAEGASPQALMPSFAANLCWAICGICVTNRQVLVFLARNLGKNIWRVYAPSPQGD